MNILSALKGIGGEFEINRVVGAFGALTYVIGANGFVAYEIFANGRAFDLIAYCTAFPTGLGIAVGSIAGAVAIKDRNVAKAQQTNANNSPPTGETP